jgi:hypothetical protein
MWKLVSHSREGGGGGSRMRKLEEYWDLKWLVTGWRKLYNEELHNLYFVSNSIRTIEWRRMRRVEKHLAGIGGLTDVYKTVFANPESKRAPWRPRKRWENIMRRDLKQWGGRLWTSFVLHTIEFGSGLLWTPGVHRFSKNMSHFKIIGAVRVTWWSSLDTADPQIWGETVRNFLSGICGLLVNTMLEHNMWWICRVYRDCTALEFVSQRVDRFTKFWWSQ